MIYYESTRVCRLNVRRLNCSIEFKRIIMKIEGEGEEGRERERVGESESRDNPIGGLIYAHILSDGVGTRLVV